MSPLIRIRMKLAHGISEMRPVPKTMRIRHQLVHWISVKHDSVPPGVEPFVVVATERSGSSLLMDLLSSRWATIRSDGEIFNTHVRRGNVVRQFVSLQIARKDKIWRQPSRYPRSGVMVRAVEVRVDELLAYENHQKLAYETLEGFLAGLDFLKTTYETLMEDMDLEIRRVGEFLGVGKPDFSTSPRLRHQNPEPLSQLISNFDQLRRDLAELGRADLARQVDG
jgi:LPS sulfotransferase NodH